MNTPCPRWRLHTEPECRPFGKSHIRFVFLKDGVNGCWFLTVARLSPSSSWSCDPSLVRPQPEQRCLLLQLCILASMNIYAASGPCPVSPPIPFPPIPSCWAATADSGHSVCSVVRQAPQTHLWSLMLVLNTWHQQPLLASGSAVKGRDGCPKATARTEVCEFLGVGHCWCYWPK